MVISGSAPEFGLLRFDGVRGVPWTAPAGESLPSAFILSVLAARDGRLWIGTDAGLASWKDNKLTHYPELDGQSVVALLEDREGSVWAAGEGVPTGRLCTMRGGSTQCFGKDGSLGVFVEALYEDPAGEIWVGGPHGRLWRWKPGPPKFYAMPDNVVTAEALITADNGGGLLVATENGIRQLVDGKATAYRVPGYGQFALRSLFRDRDGGMWIGTADRGLLHVHQGRTDVFAQSDGLSGDNILNLFEDREGNIWAATLNGLDRFREFAVPTISVKQGLSNANAWSVLATKDGSVWLGTREGLNRWKDDQVTVYRRPSSKSRLAAQQRFGSHEPQEVGRTVREITDNGLPDDRVHSLFQDDDGRIWISTASGVARFENGRFVPVSGVPDGQIHSFAGDGAGNIWFSHQDHGLFHVRDGRLIEKIPWAKLGSSVFAEALLFDRKQGGLWLGFPTGGLTYFSNGRVSASYSSAEGLEGGILGLQMDRDGTLWATTESGLSRVKNGRVTTLSSMNGLPCNGIHGVIEDDAFALWLYMTCGLVRIARSELDAWVSMADATPDQAAKRRIQVTVLDSSDGVRSYELVSGYSPHAAESTDGKLWFPALDGVGVVDPRHLPLNKLPPPVKIEHANTDGKTYDALSQLRLPALVRDLSIDYTALSFVVPEKVRFRYKLEGQDKDWREVVNVRQVQYSNLAPGNYRFRVTACNNSGVWNEEGASLDFSIAPAYYQTNWFRAFCGLMFLAMLWTVYQLRVRVLERRQAALEKHQIEIRALNEQLIKAQEAERMRISGELHDGVLQQITSLTLRLGKVKRQVPPDSEATATVTGLQQELIKIGTDIRHISHELHPALLQEAGLPAAMSAYCDEFSKVRGLPVSCETDASVQELSPGAALCLYRIAQEALGNAAKHSEAKNVEVRLARSNGRVCLSVSDDGVGCDPNQKSGGLGVINMRERVLQLQGTFEFKSEPGRGTTVKAEVPFRPAS
jgi:signal transduction histidine kinase/ligand-binding sensor domain-containing protein